MSIENQFDLEYHKKMMVEGLDTMIRLYAEAKGRILNTKTKRHYELVMEILMKNIAEVEEVTAVEDKLDDPSRRPPLEIHRN